jgi:peptidyl-prolyl cis-trans isomerase A (cyclophilin A)
MIERSFVAASIAALVLACGSAPSNSTPTESVVVATTEPQQPATPVQTPAPTGDGLFAHIKTNKGEIVCELAYKDAPLTVANFVGLATGKQKNSAKPDGTHYYDGLTFHRVIPGFMIQGGDPAGSGAGGPGYSFADELDPNTASYKAGYVRGAMAMANRGPNTNGSQFFIMHKDYGLPHSYSIFGKVVSGIETVDAIAAMPRDGRDKPTPDSATIQSITIEAKGKDAKAFDAMKVIEANKAKFGNR